jgi:hypothetical protein
LEFCRPDFAPTLAPKPERTEPPEKLELAAEMTGLGVHCFAPDPRMDPFGASHEAVAGLTSKCASEPGSTEPPEKLEFTADMAELMRWSFAGGFTQTVIWTANPTSASFSASLGRLGGFVTKNLSQSDWIEHPEKFEFAGEMSELRRGSFAICVAPNVI